MKLALFNTRAYEEKTFRELNASTNHDITYYDVPFNQHTIGLAKGFEAICVFVNNIVDASAAETLASMGVKLIALRSAGFNNVDLDACKQHKLSVVRVPAYSPYAVAEHTVGIMMTLNRKLHRAYNRVREHNFQLDGLMGFDMHGKTAGIIGTGRIGEVCVHILRGFGCDVLCYDPTTNPACEAAGARYVELAELYAHSDIISLHCPLTPDTHHIIDKGAIAQMKPGVMLVNTSRGALVDTQAVIEGLKNKTIGHLGLDVYEEEADLFFEDLSESIIHDDVFARLLTFPNVFITGHQAFFTSNALHNIVETTLNNILEFEKNGSCQNAL